MSGFFPLSSTDKKILVVGDLMLDRYWFGEVERISPEAPVPVVHINKKENRLGGAANVARNIIALGAQATLLGVVGNDEAANQLQSLCDEATINTHFITDTGIDTTLKMRVLGRQQQLIRIDFEYPINDHSIDQLDNTFKDIIQGHDVLVLSDYNKGVLKNVEAMIAYARRLNIPVLVDPKGNDYTRYSGASLVTPNRLEMSQAVGHWKTEEELSDKAEKLRQALQLEALLITRSEQGMTLFVDKARFHVDTQAQEVYDVSGAGDTVLATLSVAIAAGMSWEEAMALANKAGGIVVGKLGTSVVTLEELL